jgi:hypothetical protein
MFIAQQRAMQQSQLHNARVEEFASPQAGSPVFSLAGTKGSPHQCSPLGVGTQSPRDVGMEDEEKDSPGQKNGKKRKKDEGVYPSPSASGAGEEKKSGEVGGATKIRIVGSTCLFHLSATFINHVPFLSRSNPAPRNQLCPLPRNSVIPNPCLARRRRIPKLPQETR